VRGVLIRAAIGAGIIIVGFAIAVVVLNQTVYTPVSFVRGYVAALARHDPAAALEMAGPVPTSSSRDELLGSRIMSDIESYTVEETGEHDGVHTVVVEYRADGRNGRTTFSVSRAGGVLGIFPTWQFAESPLAQIELTVQHARDFTANGVLLVAPAAGVQTTYLAFTPGVIAFGHESELLEAATQTVVLSSPRTDRIVTVDAEANAAFLDLVDSKVRDYLDDCASQPRLFPAGCPFGQQLTDRYVGDPAWTITAYPAISLAPTSEEGVWTVPATGGVAHLDVQVESIADGSIAPLSTDVPFTIGFVVTFIGAADVAVTPQLG